MHTDLISELRKSELKRPLKDFVHDIRNPLSAISGFIDLLEETKLDEEQKEVIELIKRACSNACLLLDREISLSEKK